MDKISIEDIETRLEKLSTFELRQTARAVGVDCPASGTKAEVREKILAIAKGTASPVVNENAKGTEFADKALVELILAFRESTIN